MARRLQGARANSNPEVADEAAQRYRGEADRRNRGKVYDVLVRTAHPAGRGGPLRHEDHRRLGAPGPARGSTPAELARGTTGGGDATSTGGGGRTGSGDGDFGSGASSGRSRAGAGDSNNGAGALDASGRAGRG